MTYVIIHALAPIFVIGRCWASGPVRPELVDNKTSRCLIFFVMDFALPATLFAGGTNAVGRDRRPVAAGAGVDRRDVDHLCRDLLPRHQRVQTHAAGCRGADPHRRPAKLCRVRLPILGSVLGERVALTVGSGLYRLRLGADSPVLPADSGT